MATINYAAREISVKIVYYGPGLSGKTTNLQIIHRKIPNETRSDMVSLATETDRTLFFDFLPIDLGKIKGFTTKFQLYTVPGQVYYNATRKLVLRGVDGIVFVADSGDDKMAENIESFENMQENLAEYGYKQETIPIIFQYNKRDLPNALPTSVINQQFNKFNLPWTEACARTGHGVFETLKLIGKLVIDQLNQKYASPVRRRPTTQTIPQTQRQMPLQQAPKPTYTPPPVQLQRQEPIRNIPTPPKQQSQINNDDSFIIPAKPSQMIQSEKETVLTKTVPAPENYGSIDLEPMIPQHQTKPVTTPRATNIESQSFNQPPTQPKYVEDPFLAQTPLEDTPSIDNNEENLDPSDKEIFFTSVNTGRTKKKGKPPINPRKNPKKKFFGNFFNRDDSPQ